MIPGQIGFNKHLKKGFNMQAVCLLFAGRRGLDDQNTRFSILRIPEVSRRIKEAQHTLDSLLEGRNLIDILAYVQSPDEEFNERQNLKSLVSAIVQIGLFDRYVRYRSRPQFLVGRSNGCSAMFVCAERQSFSDFIIQSDFYREISKVTPINKDHMKLSGIKLEEFGVLKWNGEGQYYDHTLDSKEAATILQELSQNNQINQCIHVGPHYQFHLLEIEKRGLLDISSMSSIDIDPILSSFWRTA